MKFSKCLQLLVAIAAVILVPTSDAGRKTAVSNKVHSSSSPRYQTTQPTVGRSASPNRHTNSNPGSSKSTGATLVTPKDSFPHLPGTSRRDKSAERRKHDDFPALGGNRHKNVDHHARTPPPVQRKSSLPPQIESILSNNPFARLPGAHKSSKPVKQTEEFPPLSSSSDRLNANRNSALPGRSHHAGASDEQPLKSPEAHRKFSLQGFPALPGSSHAKSPSIRPSLESLATSQSKLSLDQFPALPSSSKHHGIRKNSQAGLNPSANPEQKISLDEFPALGPSKGRLMSAAYPVERSSSLTLSSQSGSLRRSSIDSTQNPGFPSQFNSPLNSPLHKNKNFFGSSSSSLTSTSGLGMSHQSTSSGSFSSLNTGQNSPGVGTVKNLRDLPKVQKAPIVVSDGTCKDDTSPAEQCFNYFTFSLFWPPALGYEYKTKNKPTNKNVKATKWSIHGLWPSSYNGYTPENCHKRTSVYFNQYRIEGEKGLKASLEGSWINICPYKQNGCSLISFWDREFTTHGACATRSPLIGSDVGYFKMAISLASKINIGAVLTRIKFSPGQIMSYGDLAQKLYEEIGTKVQIEYVKHEKTFDFYLKEIKVCYDLDLHRISCPGTTFIAEDVKILQIHHSNNLLGITQ